MNWLDIVIAVFLIFPIFTGLKQGLIKAALSLAGLLVGVVLASNFYQQLASVLSFIKNEDVANITAFITILVAIMVIANVAAVLLKIATKAMLLGWVDHLGGAIFGFLMGTIFISAMLAAFVNFFGTGLVTESWLAGILLDKFPLVLSLLPSEFNAIRNFFQ